MGEAATEYGQPNIKAAQPSREPKLPGELHPQMYERKPSQPGIRGPPGRAAAALCFIIQGFVGSAGWAEERKPGHGEPELEAWQFLLTWKFTTLYGIPPAAGNSQQQSGNKLLSCSGSQPNKAIPMLI